MILYRCNPTGREPFARPLPVRVKGALSEVNGKNPIMYLKKKMDGSQVTVYHVNIIDQLGQVFVHDGVKYLSHKQERFFNQFIKACQIIHDNYIQGKEDIYEGVDESFKSLDQFLGNYIGVDDEQYTR